LEIEYEKLKERFDNKKIVEKLLRKWFQYDDIKEIMNNWKDYL
jgi:SOS response regulatory protein OraA/RecX